MTTVIGSVEIAASAVSWAMMRPARSWSISPLTTTVRASSRRCAMTSWTDVRSGTRTGRGSSGSMAGPVGGAPTSLRCGLVVLDDLTVCRVLSGITELAGCSAVEAAEYACEVALVEEPGLVCGLGRGPALGEQLLRPLDARVADERPRRLPDLLAEDAAEVVAAEPGDLG